MVTRLKWCKYVIILLEMQDRAYSKTSAQDLKMVLKSRKITLVEVVARFFTCGNTWKHILKDMITHYNTF